MAGEVFQINGVTIKKVNANTFKIIRQAVGASRIPELNVRVSVTSKDVSVKDALTLLTQNLTTNSYFYDESGILTRTKAGYFLTDAYNRNLSGNVNFTDIRGTGQSVLGLFGIPDSERTTLGSFGYDTKEAASGWANGRVSDSWGTDFTYNIDVPNFQLRIDRFRQRITTFRKALSNGTISPGQNGISYSILDAASSRLKSDLFTSLTGHELGGHGNNPGVNHSFATDWTLFRNDPAFVGEWSDVWNTGGYYVGPYGPQGKFRTGPGYNAEYGTEMAVGIDSEGVDRTGMRLQEIAEGDYDAQTVTDAADTLQAYPDLLISQFGGVLGSTIGSYLFADKPLLAIGASALLSTVGQNVGQFIQAGGLSSDVSKARGALDDAFDDFGVELKNALANAAIGSVSSFLTLELGNALGLTGFGAELFQTASGTVLGTVLSNAVNKPISELFSGLDSSGLFGTRVDVNAIGDWNPGALTSAVGSFFGAKLGSLILGPTNTVGSILSSVGSAVGGWAFGVGAASAGAIGNIGASIASAFGSLGNFAAPFVGSLVGFLLGSLIGRLFGRKKPRVPTASAETYLSVSTGHWSVGQIASANGGSVAFATDMARTSSDGINSILDLIRPDYPLTISNPSSESHRYGHSGGTVYFDQRIGSSWVRQYSGSNADDAVEKGVLSGVRSTKIVGGDIFLKRALYHSLADTTTGLLGNLQIASDYAQYLAVAPVINELIRRDPTSALAAGWIVTLARVDELRINQFQPSDFYGGLGGFASSFGIGRGGVSFESVSLTFEGSALRIGTTDGSGPFGILASTNNIQDPSVARQSVLIAEFGANVGYTNWAGQATAGNDIWIATGAGPVSMDDLGYQEYWQWNPWDYTYEPYYVEVSGGDDIFVGSAYSDTLQGRAGLDWLDGNAGDDMMDGGDNDDVLLGRAGNDRMLGGNGDDYLAGGEGDDYFYDANRTWGLYGGDGNDVLVGGAGTDSLYGDNGDDVFIVDQDGGGTWDALTGMAGSDTLSYERFTSGVYIDFATLGGWSWDPTAKYIYGDAIAGSMENVTGSNFEDFIYGDATSNILRGLDGNDSLFGREGDDVLDGGLGADILDGSWGWDTASYERSSEGVTVDLGQTEVSGGDAAGDVLYSVENVKGSHQSDLIGGDAGDNSLSGLRGNDYFTITGGNDVIDGGEGLDTVDASLSSSALLVYYDEGSYDPYYGYYTPGAGWIASTGSGTTNFSSVEGFVGTSFADTISGSGSDEVFEGGAGNDYLAGAGGSDTFLFGRGDGQDTVYASSVGASAIVLEDDINWRDVSIIGANYSQQYGNLTVAIRGTSDQMTVGSNFYYVNSGSMAGQHNHSIKTLNLGGVSTVDIDMIDWTPYAADDASTVVYGAQNRADLIFAYAGDDTIYAAGSSYTYETRGNVIYAGDGADTIYSSAGDDQFIFERGNGADTLIDGGGADTVVMGPSVSADDVIYEVVSYGSSADLFIGIRDPNNPNATASQVADRIRVVDGGMKYIGTYYGGQRLNTIEHIRVGGQEIDLTKAGINWAIGYEYDGGGYYGGGGGGWGGGGGYNIPPIAIDLDGDGIELRSVEGSRIATVAADGTITRMGWLGQDDGFLALDRDGNGVIDRIGEISFIGDKPGAKTDLEALAAYDTNGDDRFDASDTRWGEFTVWQDRNQDGFGSTDELLTLEQAGIASISLKGQLTGFTASDGPDNVVIATTEIGWADPNRVGSAYDVALAQLQVRTDEGGAERASIDAGARGGQIEGVDAQLRGVQSLTEEQVATLREKRGHKKTSGDGGLLYRVEDLLGGGATAVANGLLSIDPKMAKSIADAGRALGMIDRYADSAWTQLGSIALGEADMRGTDVRVEKRKLGDAEKAAVATARMIVGDRAIADAGKAAEMAIGDAADAVATPTPVPPTAAELERLKRLDTFRLLEKDSGSDPADAEEDATSSELMRQSAASDASQMPDQMAAPLLGEDLMVPQIAAQDAPRSAQAETIAFQPAIDDTLTGGGTAEAVDADVYGVVIRTANARLVQALAGFGDAPTMMASYQGVNVANDPQSAWLSVDAMPSVQRLAAIR